MFTRIQKAWNTPTPRRQRATRLSLEGLEERLALSTLYVMPWIPYNGYYGFYNNFSNAYGAARPGDTIQLEPGASVQNGNSTTIGKQLTIQGDPQYSAKYFPVYGDVKVTQGGSGTVFNNLNFNQYNLTTDWSTNGVEVENSLLNNASFNGGGGYMLSNNTIQGSLMLSTYGTKPSYVEINHFTGHGNLWMQGGHNDFVDGNTFQTDSSTAMTLFYETGAYVGDNRISFTTPSRHHVGIFLGSEGGMGTSVQLDNNQVQTGKNGEGLVIDKYDTRSSMQVKALYNNFGGNATGVEVIGDGKSVGSIDLGTNDFSDYHGGDGRLAIAVENAYNSAIVWAQHDTWGTYPPNVIKDASDNSNRPTPGGGSTSPGAGWVYWYNN
jgi:hypothetical protein